VCVCLCLVCGLLAACILAFLLYHYLRSYSDEANVEHRENKVTQKQEKSSGEGEVKHTQSKITQKKKKMSTLKLVEHSAVPAFVYTKMKGITVLNKTVTYTIGGRVSFMPNAC